MDFETILENEKYNIVNAIDSLNNYPAKFILKDTENEVSSIPYLKELVTRLRRESSKLQLQVATSTVSSIEAYSRLTLVSSIISDINSKVKIHMRKFKDNYPMASDRISTYKRT